MLAMLGCSMGVHYRHFSEIVLYVVTHVSWAWLCSIGLDYRHFLVNLYIWDCTSLSSLVVTHVSWAWLCSMGLGHGHFRETLSRHNTKTHSLYI